MPCPHNKHETCSYCRELEILRRHSAVADEAIVALLFVDEDRFPRRKNYGQWVRAVAAAAYGSAHDRLRELLAPHMDLLRRKLTPRGVPAAALNPQYEIHYAQGSKGVEGDSGHKDNRYG